MSTTYNIYCDESCYLEHDNIPIMLFGGSLCPKDQVKTISKEIRVKHLGRDVAFNGVIDEFSQGKVEGFWHVITRDNATKTNRLIDYPRAERLSWAKPLIENPYHDEIKFFFYDEGIPHKGIRHYIWFEEGNYVVILRKRRDDYFWITAFFVDDWKRKDLQKRFEKRICP